MEKYKPTATGLIIDVSLERLASVKEIVINSIHKLNDQFYTDDRIYLYDPQSNRIPTTRPSQISSVFNFVPQQNFCVLAALKQTTYLVGYEEKDLRKNVILITDRYDAQKEHKYKKALSINDKEKFDCQFFFIEIGCKKFPNYDGINFILANEFDLEEKILGILNGTNTNITDSSVSNCSSSCQQREDA